MEDNKKIKYKDAIGEIEEILSKIENEELDVDELSAKIKRVTHLLSICKSKLKTAETDVEKIINEMNN